MFTYLNDVSFWVMAVTNPSLKTPLVEAQGCAWKRLGQPVRGTLPYASAANDLITAAISLKSLLSW